MPKKTLLGIVLDRASRSWYSGQKAMFEKGKGSIAGREFKKGAHHKHRRDQPVFFA
jgi:hypothetical protein